MYHTNLAKILDVIFFSLKTIFFNSEIFICFFFFIYFLFFQKSSAESVPTSVASITKNGISPEDTTSASPESGKVSYKADEFKR